jgi:hypothetical protein
MDSYEMRELAMFRKQMEEVERLPLAERKENAMEWFNDLMNDQKLIAERVGWLLNGSYGKGSFDSACRVLASPRMNQVAWCAITIANLEWRCPAKMAIASWKKLPVETRYIVNEAIRREIADAKAEGICGEIKKNGGKTYEYYINNDERGEFGADVRDPKNKTVFEIKGGEIFMDGFMKDKHDLPGLEDYLKSLKILKTADRLVGATEYRG